ncbi:hypothetical protein BDA96_01G082700 [Sorghum bicolor]|jgi:hypothetical protein|uniref:Uncharacterized protein n=1 Tax=Sorghum bicolor TaxID=4558 RepID=A0A921UWX4_SORBI|nr:hypothetical protein BDA96_01G082700 [Sorghum bicolor]
MVWAGVEEACTLMASTTVRPGGRFGMLHVASLASCGEISLYKSWATRAPVLRRHTSLEELGSQLGAFLDAGYVRTGSFVPGLPCHLLFWVHSTAR